MVSTIRNHYTISIINNLCFSLCALSLYICYSCDTSNPVPLCCPHFLIHPDVLHLAGGLITLLLLRMALYRLPLRNHENGIRLQ